MILTLLGEGRLKKEIADRLKFSYATVDEHVAHIYARLGVRNARERLSRIRTQRSQASCLRNGKRLLQWQ
jgi:DNA-binding NarL/FixJ family response regulator